MANMGGLGKRGIHEHCMDKGVVDNLQIHPILLSGNTIFCNSFMSGFHTGLFPGRGQRRCMQRAHMHVSVPAGGGLEIQVLPPPCPPSPPKPPCETVLFSLQLPVSVFVIELQASGDKELHTLLIIQICSAIVVQYNVYHKS